MGWLLATVGFLAIAQAVAFRLGYSRRLGEPYLDSDLPDLLRHVPFTLVPSGFGVLALSSVFFLPQGEVDVAEASDGLFVLAVLAVGFCLGWTILRYLRPPPRYLIPADGQRELKRPPGEGVPELPALGGLRGGRSGGRCIVGLHAAFMGISSR